MFRRVLSLGAVFALPLILAACSSHLSSTAELDPEILQARAEYESPWKEAIAKQEIHKGMSKTDVYFAWGRPQHRFRTGDNERWIYLFEGEAEQPDRVVWLHFKNGTLKRWTVDRGFMEFVNPTSIESEPGDTRMPADTGGK